MIKTIVIDLGGVYFESGTKIALQQIYKVVEAPKEKIHEIFEAHPHKEGFLYRKGELTKEQFWAAAIKKLRMNKKLVPQLQKIWHSSYKPIQGMPELVAELNKNYKTIAFSGNIKERIEYLNKKYQFKENFDDFVFSFDVHLAKGQIEFYKILLERIKCKPEECVYIDDYKGFLDIAESFGIKTVLFKSSEQLKSELRKLDIKV